jgi:hypothetical protein
MNVKVQYEKVKVSFDYLGKNYSGEIVCSNLNTTTYWFVFDQIDVKPFGGSIEFKLVKGQLESVEDFSDYELFILCITTAMDKHRKELCN